LIGCDDDSCRVQLVQIVKIARMETEWGCLHEEEGITAFQEKYSSRSQGKGDESLLDNPLLKPIVGI
jgi:Fe-S cluster assembly scaffold protein SufB